MFNYYSLILWKLIKYNMEKCFIINYKYKNLKFFKILKYNNFILDKNN